MRRRLRAALGRARADLALLLVGEGGSHGQIASLGAGATVVAAHRVNGRALNGCSEKEKRARIVGEKCQAAAAAAGEKFRRVD